MSPKPSSPATVRSAADPTPPTPFTTFVQAAATPPAFMAPGDATPPRPVTRMPLVPAAVLKQHRSFISTDTRFRAAARLLQSLWRADQQLPMGHHVTPNGQPTAVKLGSRLTAAAGHAGHNFVAPDVHALVRRELVLREEGACIDEDRLFTNLLSSMPLAFNLLGPLALDLDLAGGVLSQLLPTFVGSVQGITFEHAPGRGDPLYLADGTAFDAVASVTTPDGEPATVFIEVKYSEGLTGPAATPRPRYDEASRQVRLFHDPDSPELRSLALEQLWREHMLAQLAVDRGAANKAIFIAIAPRLNRRVADAFQRYASHLADPEPEDELRVPFVALTLEACVEALAAADATDLAGQLHRRYLDFHRVLALALAPPAAKPPSSPRRRTQVTPQHAATAANPQSATSSSKGRRSAAKAGPRHRTGAAATQAQPSQPSSTKR